MKLYQWFLNILLFILLVLTIISGIIESKNNVNNNYVRNLNLTKICYDNNEFVECINLNSNNFVNIVKKQDKNGENTILYIQKVK